MLTGKQMLAAVRLNWQCGYENPGFHRDHLGSQTSRRLRSAASAKAKKKGTKRKSRKGILRYIEDKNGELKLVVK